MRHSKETFHRILNNHRYLRITMNSSPDQLIIESAIQHAINLNLAKSFGDKWNSEAGIFLRGLTANRNADQSFKAQDIAEILFHLGIHSKDSGFNFSLAAHLLAGVIPVRIHGNNSVHFEALNAIEKGAIYANAMTETSSGGNSFGMRTTATKSENGYVLNGSKTFITNGPIADYFIVYALTNPDSGFFGGVSCFLLDKKIHSFIVGPAIEKISLSSSPMSEVFFENCFVSEEYMLGKPGSGAMIFLESMDWERACIAAMHAGTMYRLSTIASDHVKSRSSGNKNLSELQGVQFKIAEIALLSDASYLVATKAACLTDERKGSVCAAQAKILSSENLLICAKIATELLGGYGLTGNHELTTVMTDAQAALIYSGPNDLLREFIASRL